ncbi:NAD(P)H-hydrate epimerase [Homoserinibacter sp. YIM 151385]|uniref:NAD(P)H-hydrate epimerase n=1 Tax=Homoserinibacter sp. YIM 151385 TaxID=2985506 RepID=UPI0022F032D8|nr:NAD(P)H-hydrate epimerase [Homoserinibacter sp. YIM 151385]WBU38773.1 NAD(P)H-hydrate epimerase [Homoserinibacter sp. YIM 151385]
MRRAWSAAEIRAAERPLVEAGVPLMARAAAGLAALLRERVPADRLVLVLAGSGDNGADALYAGAELAAAGRPVAFVALGGRIHEAARSAAVAAGARQLELRALLDEALEAGALVDGVLGTGSTPSPALRDPAASAIGTLRSLLEEPDRPLVIAVDLPSGLHPDTGEAPDGNVLPADATAVFGALKTGLLLGEGPRLAGELVLVDIGLGPALEGVAPGLELPD